MAGVLSDDGNLRGWESLEFERSSGSAVSLCPSRIACWIALSEYAVLCATWTTSICTDQSSFSASLRYPSRCQLMMWL